MDDFTHILKAISEGTDLEHHQAEYALKEIISGKVNASRTAAFLFGMRCKGETVEELSALVKVMREASIPVEVDTTNAVDLCGTGGDNSGTFNISTAAMFVVAGADVPVLKHGNAGISSRSGSFDVLKSLGAEPEMNKDMAETCFRQTGMTFMFAPLFHPAMAKVMTARKDLGMRTFFNILGPLLNPADVKRQIIGAYNREIAGQIIRILTHFDTEFAYTVHAEDGLDELSTTSLTHVYQLMNGEVNETARFDPRILGMSVARPDELKGGDPEYNAGIIRAVLDDRGTNAQRDIVLLNATFGIHASGLFTDIQDAYYEAEESLESGSAKKAMERFAEATSDIKAAG